MLACSIVGMLHCPVCSQKLAESWKNGEGRMGVFKSAKIYKIDTLKDMIQTA